MEISRGQIRYGRKKAQKAHGLLATDPHRKTQKHFEIKIPNDETLAAMSEAEQLNGDFVSIDDFAK